MEEGSPGLNPGLNPGLKPSYTAICNVVWDGSAKNILICNCEGGTSIYQGEQTNTFLLTVLRKENGAESRRMWPLDSFWLTASNWLYTWVGDGITTGKVLPMYAQELTTQRSCLLRD